METRKVLVKEEDVAVLTCPFCRKTKNISVAEYKEKRKRELKIRCSCTQTFCVCLEFRKHPRKPVKMLGRSINLTRHRENRDILITNISLGGIGFCFFEKRHRIAEDDGLQVAFTLNDPVCSPIDAQVTVRCANKNYIGCEFKSIEQFKAPLGFYLIS